MYYYGLEIRQVTGQIFFKGYSQFLYVFFFLSKKKKNHYMQKNILVSKPKTKYLKDQRGVQPNTTVPDVDGLREEWASESGQVHIFSALTQHCFLLQTQNTGFNRPLVQLTHISHVLMLSMGRSFFLLGTIYKTHRLVLVHIQPVKSHVIYYLGTSNV